MTLNLGSVLKYSLLLIIAGGVLFLSYSQYTGTSKLNGNNILYRESEVLGVSTDEAQVSVDFSQQTQQSSNLIFGGAHAPRHAKAWDEVQNGGFTSLRSDFFLDRFLPTKITLEQYKQNVNGVQNPQNWNQAEINKVRGIYQEAHKRNMKTIGILAYSASWLTTSGTPFGPPKDWGVYDDVIEKSYKLFRNDVDYLEIWNEPDMDVFMNTKNSGMNKETAYAETVKHAIAVIRKVDNQANDGKRMKIGVGVMSQPTNIYILDKVLVDPNIRKEVDFVSYHNYEHIPEPSNGGVQQTLKKYGMDKTPIYLTEWSHSPNMKKPDPMVLTDLGIAYTGSKLIDFMNMGIAGANFFSLQPIMPDSPRGDEGFLGLYNTNGDSVSMLPLIKTWTLMSKTLGLGQGENKIFKVDNDGEKVAAWQNSKSEYGLVIANNGYSPKQYNFSLYNLPDKGNYIVSAYVASNEKDGKEKIGSTSISNKSTGASFKAVVPPNSMVGITINKASWKESILSR